MKFAIFWSYLRVKTSKELICFVKIAIAAVFFEYGPKKTLFGHLRPKVAIFDKKILTIFALRIFQKTNFDIKPKGPSRRKNQRINILNNFGDCFKALGASTTGAPSQGGSDHMNFWPKSKKCPNTPKIEFLSVLTYFNVFKTKNYPNIGLLWVWLWKKYSQNTKTFWKWKCNSFIV